MNALRIANFDYFMRRDFAAVIHDTLDITALKGVSAHIVPAVGRQSQAGRPSITPGGPRSSRPPGAHTDT
ncbi:hypothetical protein AB0L99_26570 [Streptomyces sp. NPDC051954]|uniref:hypothetical protein n=1 Tax=Streptomyces sp. NPDC051954 TaxID=3155524 RepID=UPI00341ED417